MSDVPGSRKRTRAEREAEAVAGSPAEDIAVDSDIDAAAAEDEGEGEDLLEDLEGDYRAMPELDQYDERDLDERDYAPISFAARQAAEASIREREKSRTAKADRVPAALLADDEDDDGDEERLHARRRRRLAEQAAMGEVEGDADDDGAPFDLENYDVPLREWVATERPRKEIKRRFRVFLETYRDSNGAAKYIERLSAMCSSNRQSLELDYVDFSRVEPSLSIWLADMPREMLAVFSETAFEVALKLFPEYHHIHSSISVRVSSLPVADTLRDLRQAHLGVLIRTMGVVTRRTGVFPQLLLVRFNCGKCGHVLGPFAQNEAEEVKPSSCPLCESKGPFILNSSQTVYRNFQKITLQESPGTVPAGRVPRYKEVILLGDLVDTARPGEEVEVTGVYTHRFDAALNARQGFPVFATVIEANHIQKKADLLSTHITEDDKQRIHALAREPDVAERLVRAIAPSIYGNEHAKLAVALAMFGGREKNVNDKHRVRGDINVLLLGDPGTAKSQVLKFVEKTASRAVYTTGKGASAVGLTAAVHKDPLTKEWTLEGGALVLADQGVCLIDEFDKMNDQDRTSIHEAMEQQSISISKAGIVTSLQARCAVIAAANPIGGRYDATRTFSENVELTDPILQRFDLLCVLQDTVNPALDSRLATFVTAIHMRANPYDAELHGDDLASAVPAAGDLAPEDAAVLAGEDGAATPGRVSLTQDLLRKFIMYARRNCHPRLDHIDQEKIARLYADLRQESGVMGGVPISVRHMESLIRVAEAHARMHLRDYVEDEDVNRAIGVVVDSFIQAQKFSVMSAMRRKFRKYITEGRDHNQLLMFALQALVKEATSYLALRAGRHALDDPEHVAEDMEVEVPLSDLEMRAKELGISNLQPFFASPLFRTHGFQLDNSQRGAPVIRRTF